MNVYDSYKTREERRTIDKQLAERAKPRMLWQTSYIVPAMLMINGTYIPAHAVSTHKGTYVRT